MDSIRLKFKASAVRSREGVLVYQIIHDRAVRSIATSHRIFEKEWDDREQTVIIPDMIHLRYERLNSIRSDIAWELKCFDVLAQRFGDKSHTVDDIADAFLLATAGGKGVFEYLRDRILHLRHLGRYRCSETMESTLRSFMRFRGGLDITFRRLTRDVVEQYEAYLKSRGLTRNTSSFYMRNFRAAYNSAVDEDLTVDNHPFRNVYTGVDRTSKRAIAISDIRRLKALDLRRHPSLEFARDMLLFSFYTRGMSFVDMAYLRKKDMTNGYITYRRKKTGRRLTMESTGEVQAIVAKYGSRTQYLLPIITSEDGNERRQYKSQLMRVNRLLKKVGEMAGLTIPLSTYVMRHAWATIARDKGIELSVISAGLGHDNEATTRIYLDSIRAVKVDRAHRAILDDL